MKSIQLYVAGVCRDTSGPGGYGAVLVFGEHRMELSGGYRITTTSRMELMAIIMGLGALHERCNAEVYTGSKYVVSVLSKGWAAKWRDNGWQRNNGEPAIDPDLLGQLLETAKLTRSRSSGWENPRVILSTNGANSWQ